MLVFPQPAVRLQFYKTFYLFYELDKFPAFSPPDFLVNVLRPFDLQTFF